MEDSNARSLCILCYKPASNENENLQKVLKILSSYLNINLKIGDNIQEELLSCDVCFELGETFCVLLFQWENLRLQLEWRVRRLFETMRAAGRVSSRVKAFRNQFLDEKENELNSVCRDIQKLRGDVLRGCKKKMSSFLPKVVLKRIPEEGDSKECQKVVKNLSEETQLMKALMTFIAVLHLLLPLHSQNFTTGYHHHHQREKKVMRDFIDKQVQTCSSDMLHGNKNENDGLPPILTPFDFYNDESGRAQFASITVPNATVGTIGKISDLMDENIISTARVVLPAASHSLTKSTNCTLHRKAKIPQTRFKCGKCRQSFLTNTKLRSHIYHLHGQSQRRKKNRKTHRPSSKPWSSYLREVLNIKCPICNLAFKDHEILANHVRLAHQRILAYDCVNCNTKLKTVEGVRSHMYFSHGKIFQSNQELLSLKNVKCNYTFVDAPTGPGMTLFPVVAEVQQSPTFLTQSSDNPAETNSIVNKNSIQSIIKTQYQCMWPMCGKKFASSGGRARHYKTHTECNSYQCRLCEKFYSRNCALNRHMRNTHGFQSRFPNTNDNSDQLGQKQRVDDGAKETEPVNMLIESLIANYSTAPVLNNHKSQGGNHNEEQESFEAIIDQPVLKCGCPKMGCERRVSSQTEVINYHHSHHGNCHPGEESEVEPEPTNSTAITKRAPLAGSPIPIYQRTRNDMCPKSARKLRYQCHWEGCKWKFRDKYEFTRHLRTHTGETPFRCAVCFQLFARSDNLKTHNIKCKSKSPQ